MSDFSSDTKGIHAYIYKNRRGEKGTVQFARNPNQEPGSLTHLTKLMPAKQTCDNIDQQDSIRHGRVRAFILRF